uniref:COX assembly mitochondrial protein n=1 Tax=Capra hircus TaxID=9925 RepID=A0A8C2RXY2_CAPHI
MASINWLGTEVYYEIKNEAELPSRGSVLTQHMWKQDFTKCCKDSGVLMVVKCRKENSALKDCLTSYYKDPAFYEECKMEYLKEREEFRRTGIPTKKRLQKLPTSFHMNITRQCID